MPLVDVERISWSTFSFLGGRLRRSDGSGIRTLVTGTTWDELWTPRARKIEREILRLAELARGERPTATAVPSLPVRTVVPSAAPGARFTRVRLREGYDIGEVDAFLDRVASGALGSDEIQTVRFTPVRFKDGYALDQVDEYLDRISDQLRSEGR